MTLASSATTTGTDVDGTCVPASGVEQKMMRSLRSTINAITKDADGARRIAGSHFLDGSFRKLCQQESFSELLFPGLSTGLRNHMPKNLKEVLEWDDLDIDLRTVARSASEVLENVKLKGTARGDIMDAESEAVLLPQIAQEALANGIVRAVRNLGRRVSHMNAKTSQPIASTSAPQAHLDQLESTLLEELLSASRAGVQRCYLGAEWSGLVRADMERFVREEAMSAVDCNGGVVVQREVVAPMCSASDTTPFGRIAWLDGSGGWSDSYPALSEAVTQLHALPFEINLKLDGRPGWDLRLLEPSRTSTLLVHVPAGARQTTRFDSRADGGDLDSGFRLTSSYFVAAAAEGDPSPASHQRVNFLLSPSDIHPVLSVPIANDLLVIHHSAEVLNERTDASTEYFILVCFMHAKKSRPMRTIADLALL